MTYRPEDLEMAVLAREVRRLSKQVRLDRALALSAIVLVALLLATGQKANTPRKLVAQELSMVDENGNEWAVLGLDKNQRRGVHLFSVEGGVRDRSQPLLSLIGNCIELHDRSERTLLSLQPRQIELTTGEARAEISIGDKAALYVDGPAPKRSVFANLYLSA